MSEETIDGAGVSVSQSNAVLLARIDERTKATQSAVEALNTTISSKYVTQDEFRPVKALVYGAVGLMLTAIVVALVALVVHK